MLFEFSNIAFMNYRNNIEGISLARLYKCKIGKVQRKLAAMKSGMQLISYEVKKCNIGIQLNY